MSTIRNPVAMAASALALLSILAIARTSSADETRPKTSTTTAPTTTQPAQPVPGTTTTTSASYAPSAGTSRTEKIIEHRPNRALLSTGGSIFILSYGSSVVAAAVSSRDADKRLFIPVVGPWSDLANRGCTPSNPCENEGVAKAMLITSGVAQGAGLLLALGGLVIPESSRIEERTTVTKVEKPSFRIVPLSFKGGFGLGAVGRF